MGIDVSENPFRNRPKKDKQNLMKEIRVFVDSRFVKTCDELVLGREAVEVVLEVVARGHQRWMLCFHLLSSSLCSIFRGKFCLFIYYLEFLSRVIYKRVLSSEIRQ